VVALLLYAYARGNRSSRGIERACWEDVAYKVITGMRTPDHSTIAEFRRRHESEIGELFDDVLGLCREAGLVSVGVITIDGTKIKANASMDQNRSYRDLVTEILREAEETDRREDELYGQSRGDEPPEQLRTAEGRRQALADAKRRLAERKARPADDAPVAEMELDLESTVLARPVLRRGGRREWFRVARSELDAHRARQAAPIPRDREDRLLGALERFEENQRVDLAANAAYERWRATARDTKGRVLKGNSKPYTPPELPEGVINLSDPDSRVMRTQGTPPRQAYNAQAAVNDRQIILAAEISIAAPDFGHLGKEQNLALSAFSDGLATKGWRRFGSARDRTIDVAPTALLCAIELRHRHPGLGREQARSGPRQSSPLALSPAAVAGWSRAAVARIRRAGVLRQKRRTRAARRRRPPAQRIRSASGGTRVSRLDDALGS
jgi:transposase-like protein DUF772